MEFYPITTSAATQFRTALATNAGENANLVLSSALEGVNLNANNVLAAITILSKENLAWELQWYGKDTFQTCLLYTSPSPRDA